MIDPDINEQMARYAPSQRPPRLDRLATDIMAAGPGRTVEVRDPIADSIVDDRQDTLAASLLEASKTNPDEAARALQLARDNNVGSDIALRNMKELEQQARIAQVQDLELPKRNPILSRMLEDREFARVAQDDIKNLNDTGSVFLDFVTGNFGSFSILGELSAGATRASLVTQRGQLSVEGMTRDLTPFEEQKLVTIEKELEKVSEIGFLSGAAEQIAYLYESVPYIIGGVAKGAAAGAAAGVAGTLLAEVTIPAFTVIGAGFGLQYGIGEFTYVVEAGNAYRDMIFEGRDVIKQRLDAGEIDQAGYDQQMYEMESSARSIATGVGLANAVLEVGAVKLALLPFKAALAPVLRQAFGGAVKNVTRREAFKILGFEFMKQVGGQGATELVQELNIIVGEELQRTYGSKLPTKMSTPEGREEIAQRLIDTFEHAVVGFTILGTFGPTAQYYSNVRRAESALQTRQFFSTLSEQAKAGNLITRSPEMYQRVIAGYANGTDAETTYINGRELNGVLQQLAISRDEFASRFPDLARQLDQAMEFDQDVTLPTAEFAAKMSTTNLGQALLQHVRVDPQAMSPKMADEFLAQRPRLLQEAREMYQQKESADQEFVASGRRVEQAITADLEATGQYKNKADIRAVAQVARDMYTALAKRTNKTPEAVYEQYRNRVQLAPAQAEQAQALEQAVTPAPEVGVFDVNNPPVAKPGMRPLSDGPAIVALMDHDGKVYYDVNATMHGDIVDTFPEIAETVIDSGFIIDGKYVMGTPDGGYSAYESLDEQIAAVREFTKQVNTPRQRPLGQASRIDAEYLAAVERGDMETAQRMVDQAAKKAGFTISVYHGTSSQSFTQFETGRKGFRTILLSTTEVEAQGFFFSELESDAQGYGRNVRRFFLDPRSRLQSPDELPLSTRSSEAEKAASKKAWADAEYILEPAIYEEDGEMFINTNHGVSRTKVDADGEWVSKVFYDGNIDWALLDMPEVVSRMKKMGYSSVKAGESNDVSEFSWFVTDPNQIKSADPVTRDEQGNVIPLSRRFDITSPRIFEQAAKPTRLMAVHNLSADNLAFAEQMGGLAVPSIGVVTEKRGGIEGFGEITLIGTQEMADPATSRVFSSDAYSARFPRAEWPKVKRADTKRIIDEIRDIATEFDERYLIDQTYNLLAERPNAHGLVDAWRISPAVMALFLRSKGFDARPVTYQPYSLTGLSWDSIDQLDKLYKAVDWSQDWESLNADPAYTALTTAYSQEWTSQLGDAVSPESLARISEFGPGTESRLRRDLANVKRLQVDREGSRQAFEAELQPYAVEFKDWVDSKILDVFGDPFLRVNGKKVAYTLPNIVKYMSDARVINREKGMTFSPGAARAATAAEFVDLEQMRDAAKKSIVDPSEFSRATKKTEKLLDEYRNEMIRYADMPTWDALDASMRAVARYANARSQTDATMRSVLRAEGFEDAIPDSVIALAKKASDALMAAPVPYFEAKPQRAVRIGEFAGAVIPSNATQETRDILDRNGVRYMTYLADNEQDRQRAVREMARSPEAAGQVLFQAPVTPGFYSALEREVGAIDAEYLAAVERGDMETAQRMVDEAAKSSGLTERVWRGDRAGAAITQYPRGARREPGIFTTTTQEIADRYAGGAGLARQFYVGGRTLDLTRPTAKTVRWIRKWAADAEWDFVDRTTGEQIAPEDAVMSGLLFDWEGTWSGARWKDIQATAAEQGYDIIKLMDMDEQPFVSTVVLNETRIKLADPVTRDEQGNVIPLSRRFDITSPRIFEQADRGPARGWFDPITFITTLTSKADQTTFLHELAHFYLSVLMDVATTANPPAEITADLDNLFQWFGIDGATQDERFNNWLNLSFEQQRKYHEQFAYSFEIYLFENKAPSIELRGAFARFASWFRQVYRNIRDELNAIYREQFGTDLPILTPEIRSVMDRMLADEDQIARQAAVNDVKAYYQTQEESGMDNATWLAYQMMAQETIDEAVAELTAKSLRNMQWLDNAKSAYIKNLQKKNAALRAEVREEVEAELELQRQYRTMQYLKRGVLVDVNGTEQAVQGPHKLDKAELQQSYESLPELQRPNYLMLGTGRYGMIGKDGVSAEVVANLFGYGSGDEMIRDLLATKPLKDAIEERTDAVMLERYGDLQDPKSMERAANAALQNDARARFLAVELRNEAQATQPARFFVEAAKQAAEEFLANKKLKNLRPIEFVQAEGRNAKDARDVLRMKTAPIASGQSVYASVYDAEIAAGVDAATAQATAQAARDRYQAEQTAEREAAFMARFGNVTPTEAIIRAKRAQLFNNQLARQGYEIQDQVRADVKYMRRVLRPENVAKMDASFVDQLQHLLTRFNLTTMTQKQLEDHTNIVQWMVGQEEAGVVFDFAPGLINPNRATPYQNLTVQEFRDLVDAVKQIEYVGKNERRVRLAGEKVAYGFKRDQIVASIRANWKGEVGIKRQPITTAERRMDGMKRYFYDHLKAASVARIMDGGNDGGPMWEYLILSANKAGDMETTMRAKATKELTEILAPLFALGKMGGTGTFFPSINRSMNREARLVVALNMGNAGNIQRMLDGEGWTMEQVMPILNSMTEAELLAVQAVWDYLESYRPLVGAKERRVLGREPKWVEPQPMIVRSADGKSVTLRGGYYPIVYDKYASFRVDARNEQELAREQLRATFTAATTRRTHTKARVKQVIGQPLVYSLAGLYNGVNDVIHDLSWHEWLIQANRLMRDPIVISAIRETYGPQAQALLRDWIETNAEGERGASSGTEGFVNMIRQNISQAGLAFSVLTAASQTTGFANAIVRVGGGDVRVGAKWVGRGIAAYTANPARVSARVRELSEFMANRARTQWRELNELRNQVQGESGSLRGLRANGYVLMSFMQGVVDIPTWMGAYEKAIDGGFDEETAIALADQAVIDSQGSGMLKDSAAVERGGPVMKLFTVFYSYMNVVYNQAAVSTMTAKSRAAYIADMLMLLTVPVVLNYGLRSALIPNAEDDEEGFEAIARDLIAEQLSYLMGTMVIVREASYVADIVSGKDSPRRGYEGPAGLRLINETGRLVVQTKQGEFDRAFRKSLINMLGVMFGLPSVQINRTIDGLEAIGEEDVTGPEAALAPLTGVER